jgi:predicted MFS family arabinose efflux permease
MLGAGWPEGRDLFGQSSGALGIAAAGYGMGRLVTATSALPILRRWLTRRASAAFALALGGAAAVVAVTRSFPVLVLAFTGIGLASGCLDALGNRFQTVVRSVGSAGLMFGSFGIGATLGPVLIASTGWAPAFLTSAAVAVIAGATAARRSVVWPVALEQGEPPHGDHSRVHVAPWIVALSLSLFGLYCGIEVTTGNWGATYLEGHRGVSEAGAAWAMSGFWAGLTLGRLGLGLVSGPGRPLTPRQVLIASGALAVVVYVAIPFVPVPVAVALFAVAGTSLAAMFPTLMSTTADRVGVAATGRVMGWQLLSANVVELGLSAAVGVAVNQAGTGAAAAILAVLSVASLPLLVLSTRLHEADGAPDPELEAVPLTAP